MLAYHVLKIRVLANSPNDPAPHLRIRMVPPENESRSNEWFMTSGWRNEALAAVLKPLQRLQAKCNRNDNRTTSWQAWTVQGLALRGSVDMRKGDRELWCFAGYPSSS